MRAKLKISKGSNTGKIFEISVPQFVIGRAPGCNLRPQSDAISRQHCAILLHKDHVSIRDLKSRNGTVLNGEAIKAEERLSSGDELQVGPLHFEVIITDDAGVVIKEHEPSVLDHSIGSLPSDSGLISDWLMSDESTTKPASMADRETRQFKIDDDNFVPVTKAEDETAKSAKKEKKGKQEFGKLPKPGQDSTASSRDAAAETLRRMLQRGN